MAIGGSGPRFAARLEAWGDAPAVLLEEGTAISYTEVARRADAFAAQLGPEVHLLALSAANALPCLVAYLGALRAGVPVALFTGNRPAALEHCQPDAIFSLNETTGEWELDIRPQPWSQPPDSQLALILSTSGSTGSAKLVKLSKRNLEANAEAIATYLKLDSAERPITSLPMSYSYGLSVINSHLSVGAAVILTETSVADPAFKEFAERYEASSIAGVPHSYELMQRTGLLDALPPSVRTLTQAGGRMAPEMIATVHDAASHQGARLFVMYGQTEATARIAYLPPERLADDLGAIGRAIPGGELWVEDDDGRRLPAGQQGELIYRGPNVMMGYARTREDLARPPGPDILRTGDIAVQSSDGLLRITGRKSRFVKPYGLRVGLDDLEERFRKAGAAVTVTGDDQLIVVAGEGWLEAVVRRAFEDLDLPVDLLEYVAMPAIPRLAGGKPDYVEILRRGQAQRAAGAVGGFASVEALFRRLSRQPLDGDASFDSLGGDSLSYVQCSIAIEAALGVLPLAWEQMSLAALRELTPTQPAARPRFRIRWTSLESDIVVRAGAILFILLNHGLGGLSGGADILMMLAGYSWSRFQRTRLVKGAILPALADFGRRYLVFYFLMILAVSALNKELALSHLTLTSTLRGDWGGILNTYWFIECLAWCVGVVCVTAAIPPVRVLMGRRPAVFGLAFVAVAVSIRLAGGQILDSAANAYRSPDQMLAYFAAGWAIAAAGRPLRVALFALLLGLSGFAWGWIDTHIISLGIAAAIMLLTPRIAVPRPIGSAITTVAAASFYIYLLNPLPMYVTDRILHAQYGPYWFLQIVATLAGGIALYLAIERFARWREMAKGEGQSIEAAARLPA